MRTNDTIVKNVQNWLKENGKSQQWLAGELGVSRALVGHMLSGKRAILPKRIEALSKILDIPVKELIKDSSQSENLIVQLRGQTANRRSKQDLKSMLFAIDDYIGLKSR